MTRRIYITSYLLTTTLLVLVDSFLFTADNHFEFAYCLLVTLSIWHDGRTSTLVAGSLSTLLILIRFIFKEDLTINDNEITSLILPLAFTWAFVYIVLLYKGELVKSNTMQERLSAMFENATEGIIVSNSSGEILMINPKAEKMFGYASGELNHKIIELLVPAKFASAHVAHRNKYNLENSSRSMGAGLKLSGRRKDDTEFPVEISLSTFKIREELFIISFIIDVTIRRNHEEIITRANEDLDARVTHRTRELAFANNSLQAEMIERLKAEQAFRKSEYLYNVMASNFPNGFICILNKSFEYVFIDGTELSKLGFTRDKLEGTSLLNSPILPLNEEVINILSKVFNWKSSSFDVEHKQNIYSLTAVPLPDPKGFVNEILIVTRNVTEKRKAEREMQESLKKERELNDLKSKFVSIASHEFRTPLSTILSSVTLIEKYDQPQDREKKNKHIERIKSSVKNLTEILNDFLSLEKLEAGKIEVKPSSFDLVAFSKDLCEEMQTMARTGQEIIYKHTGNGAIVSLDKQLLRNLCINLLNNAIKYSPQATPVEFTTHTGGDVTISIKDYGVGIPAEDQFHLAERFFRASNVTAIQGTGLGLNIVSRYVKLMNGKINYTSAVNVGSEFVVSIPQAEILKNE